MNEFQPEDTTPHPVAAAGGAAPFPGPTAPAPPPAYAPTAPPPAYAAWDGTPPTWSPPPAKKRKAWPWVVAIVGGLVVLGGAATAVALGVAGALNADQNDAYVGKPITAADAPTTGDEVLISEDGTVAFDIGSDWVDAAELTDLSTLSADLPEDASIMGAYFTFDPTTAVDGPPSYVVVIEGAEFSRVGAVDAKFAHADFMSDAIKSAEVDGMTVTSTGPDSVTTANGLDGFVSAVSGEYQGTPIRSHIYTFARGKRVVFVQIFSYTTAFDDATAALVTDSLRIEK